MSSAPKDQLVRHSILLLVISNVGNALNVVFQMMMGRGLPPAEYTAMGAMMGLMLVVTTPLDSLRTALAHAAAVGVQADRPWVARDLAWRWGRGLLLAAPCVVVAGWCLAPALAGYCNLSSVWPARAVFLVLAVMLFSPLLLGLFQGVQHFWWMASALSLWSIFRVAAAAALVFGVAATVTSAVASHSIGIFCGLALSAIGLKGLPARPAGEPVHRHPLGGYLSRSLLALVAYALLTYMDMVLVTHHFSKDEANLFARAALVGRTVVFLPIPIAMAMFPKVVSVGASSRHTLVMLLKALGLAVLIIGGAVLVCSVVPWLPLRIMFGIKDPSLEQLQIIRWVLWAMAPLGITYMLLNFELAQHRFRLLPFLWACALGYIGGVELFHGSLGQFVTVFGTVTTLSALAMIGLVMWAQMRPTAAAH